MDLQEAINRGNNLLMAGFLAVLGFGLVPEAVRETEWIDRSDDLILVLLAIFASTWYLSGTNRFRRSLIPFGLLIVALVTKIAAFVIELNDAEAVGDEFGVIPVLVLILVLAGYILYSTGRSDLKGKTERLPEPRS